MITSCKYTNKAGDVNEESWFLRDLFVYCSLLACLQAPCYLPSSPLLDEQYVVGIVHVGVCTYGDYLQARSMGA